MSDISAGKQIRIARRDALDGDTAQTPGLIRNVAFDARNPDAAHLSAFLSTVKPGAVTGAHHHGDQETVLYVISGTSRFRWGDRLEHVVEAGPGDFVFVPSYVVHQEINASTENRRRWQQRTTFRYQAARTGAIRGPAQPSTAVSSTPKGRTHRHRTLRSPNEALSHSGECPDGFRPSVRIWRWRLSVAATTL
ncbi:hypothetical protein Misp02_63640 [Microtetraspora sp. NBRC 16547]|nr:hypothetical protein Misp02_63640 [Microtetraspora sp. NBRC 16547]